MLPAASTSCSCAGAGWLATGCETRHPTVTTMKDADATAALLTNVITGFLLCNRRILAGRHFFRRVLARRHRHLVEQHVELRPYVIPFRTRNVAIGAFLDWPDFRGGCLGFMVVEVVVAPAVGCLISLAVLDRHIRAVEGAREESFPRWLSSRTEPSGKGFFPG